MPEEVPDNYEYKVIEFINPEILELKRRKVELYEGLPVVPRGTMVPSPAPST